MFSVCRGENQNAKTGTAKSRQHHPGDGHRWVSKRDRKDLSEDSRYQDATRSTRSGPAKSRSSHGNRHGSRPSAEALGGFPQSPKGCGVGPRPARTTAAPIATDCESVLTSPLLGPWNGPTDRRDRKSVV